MTRVPSAAGRGEGRDVENFVVAGLVVATIFGQLLLFGADGALLATLAATVELALAAGLMARASRPPSMSFWRGLAVPAALLAVAMLWGALPLLAPALVQSAAGLADRNEPATTVELVKLAGVAASFLIGAWLGVDRSRLRAFWPTLTWGALLYLGVALSTRGAARGGFWASPHVQDRFVGTLLNANCTACVCAMLAVVALGVLQGRIPRLQDRRFTTVLLVSAASATVIGGVLGCALAGSRAVEAALLVAFVVLVLPAWRPGRDLSRLAAVPVGAAGLLALAALALSVFGGASRWTSIEHDIGARFRSLGGFLAMVGRSPVFGYGLGSFVPAQRRTLVLADAPDRWDFGAAHDVFIQTALEGGLPYLAILSAAAAALWLAARRGPARGDVSPETRGALVAVLLAFAGSSFDIALNMPAIATLAAVLAGTAWGRRFRTAKKTRSRRQERGPEPAELRASA